MVNHTYRRSGNDAAAPRQTLRRAGANYLGEMRVSGIRVGLHAVPRARGVRPNREIAREKTPTLGTRRVVSVGDVERNAERDLGADVAACGRDAVRGRG